MKMIRERVESKLFPGHTEEADLTQCDCGGMTFLIFQIIGQNHIHIQCALCEKTYCPVGNCTISHGS